MFFPRMIPRAALILLFACLVQAAVAAGTPPKLVVVIVVDGLPQDQVLKYRDQYGAGGFNLLLQGGAWFGNAHHAHAVTLTAPGHAAVLSGAYPYQSGIIANEWFDPKTQSAVYCTGDPAHSYIGEETKKLDGTSPANLRVSTLGDELRYRNGGQSKVLTVSGKDRGAILLAGKTGTAYMYMDKTGRFASTTYYMKETPSGASATTRAGRRTAGWESPGPSRCLSRPTHARSPTVSRGSRITAAWVTGFRWPWEGSPTRRITAPSWARPTATK